MEGADSEKTAASESISTSLLQQVKECDDAGWRRLAYLYEPVVLGWCRRAGLRQADADDVKQEVFRAVVGSIGQFRKEKPHDTFRGWLYRITRFKINDLRRRQGRGPAAVGGSDMQQRLAEEPDPLADEQSAVLASDLKGLYRRALDLLRQDFAEQTWKAFWALVVDDKQAGEVASQLGMSVGAVYVAKSRVLRRLRDEFAGLEEFASDGLLHD